MHRSVLGRKLRDPFEHLDRLACRLRHPRELGATDVTRFLASLAEAGRLSASSQTQALSALLFLYHARRARSTGSRVAGDRCGRRD